MTMQMADQVLHNHQPDILVQISRDSCSMFDFYKAEEMVETGRQVARATLASSRSGSKA
jgi:NTE family protein